jgi:DNA repair protein RAD16
MIADSDEEGEDAQVDMSLDAQLARQMQEDEYTNTKNKRPRIGYEESEEIDSEEDVFEPVPAYKGKGKGKAKATNPPKARGRGRPARSSLRNSIIDDDNSVIDVESGDEDEFKLEDDDMDLDELDADLVDLVSDSDDAPLMTVSKRKGKAKARPIRSAKKKASARLTYQEKKAKKIEAKKRNARWAHIEDKWERKRAMNRERAEQSHPKLKTMWADLAKVPVLEVQKAEQPKSITRRLKPFQLEGLSWMTRQEKTGYKGGLLGDEMGMFFVHLARLFLANEAQVWARLFKLSPSLCQIIQPKSRRWWSFRLLRSCNGRMRFANTLTASSTSSCTMARTPRSRR